MSVCKNAAGFITAQPTPIPSLLSKERSRTRATHRVRSIIEASRIVQSGTSNVTVGLIALRNKDGFKIGS